MPVEDTPRAKQLTDDIFNGNEILDLGESGGEIIRFIEISAVSKGLMESYN